MRAVAILPVKRFVRAKQRLRDALDDGPRARLAAEMAADVLEVLCAFEGLARVIVVTAEASVAALISQSSRPSTSRVGPTAGKSNRS